ncbi:MAG: hypothetical protein PHO08_15420 [Methylococcales bacterium]|nr:hypothetical protein [Methylococcales bacterium]MDD5632351.1 hypothetical protein [Methylococcales bacterium]
MALLKNEDNPEQRFRLVLARNLTLASAVGIVCLSIVIIWKGSTVAEAQSVLNSVLPLFGSWVGTVLAYYFSRENFEAATHSVNEMAKQLTVQDKLHAAKVKDIMIRRAEMHVEIVKKMPDGKLNAVSGDLKLKSILDRLESFNKDFLRIPILDENDHPLYLIHRSNIDRFLAATALKSMNVADLDLNDLLNDHDIKEILDHGFALVRLDADLAEAKDKMDGTQMRKNCLDVLVTQNGREQEPVLGWITNAEIEKVATV